MNVNQLMAKIHTEMTGDPQKDIRHLQDIATDLRREENAVELLEALTEYAFNLMPDSAKEQMIEKTFVDGKRMDQVFGEALAEPCRGRCGAQGTLRQDRGAV